MPRAQAGAPQVDGSSHLALLARARRLADHARALQLASDAADVEDLHGELCALRNALVAHVHEEADELRQLSPAARAAITEGQRRLLHQVEAIMADAAVGGASCDCVGRSAHLVGALAAQARVEAGVLTRHARRSPPPPDRGRR